MRMRFPLKGLHKGVGSISQPDGTTFDSLNVRGYDVQDNRARGGQRPGLDKWANGDQIGDSEQPVVAMTVIGALR